MLPKFERSRLLTCIYDLLWLSDPLDQFFSATAAVDYPYCPYSNFKQKLMQIVDITLLEG